MSNVSDIRGEVKSDVIQLIPKEKEKSDGLMEGLGEFLAEDPERPQLMVMVAYRENEDGEGAVVRYGVLTGKDSEGENVITPAVATICGMLDMAKNAILNR